MNITVMFWDLVDSTDIAPCLDASRAEPSRSSRAVKMLFGM
jgi:hypothetical protein